MAIRDPHMVCTNNGRLCIKIDNLDKIVPMHSILQVPAKTDLFMEGIRGFEIENIDTTTKIAIKK